MTICWKAVGQYLIVVMFVISDLALSGVRMKTPPAEYLHRGHQVWLPAMFICLTAEKVLFNLFVSKCVVKIDRFFIKKYIKSYFVRMESFI